MSNRLTPFIDSILPIEGVLLNYTINAAHPDLTTLNSLLYQARGEEYEGFRDAQVLFYALVCNLSEQDLNECFPELAEEHLSQLAEARFIQLAAEAVIKTVKQGVQCKDPEGGCQYERGTHACVVGHMLKPSLRKGLQGTYHSAKVKEALVESLGFAPTYWQLAALSTMQNWHDGINPDLTLKGLQAKNDIYQLDLLQTIINRARELMQ